MFLSTFSINYHTHNSHFLQASEDLWITAAGRMTAIIQQIIEFAKMVPGFMHLPQEDQIVLLKAGV